MPTQNSKIPRSCARCFPPSRRDTISSHAHFPTAWTRAGSGTAWSGRSLPERAVVLDLASGTGDFSRAGAGASTTGAIGGCRSHRGNAAAGARTRRGRNSLRRRHAPALPRRSIRLRVRRLRAAQFSEPEDGTAGSRAGDAAWRFVGDAGFFSSGQCRFAQLVPGLPLRAGCILGHGIAPPTQNLYVHPGFTASFRLDPGIRNCCWRRTDIGEPMAVRTSSAVSDCFGLKRCCRVSWNMRSRIFRAWSLRLNARPFRSCRTGSACIVYPNAAGLKLLGYLRREYIRPCAAERACVGRIRHLIGPGGMVAGADWHPADPA